jgi:hypothetical protein
MFFPTPEQQIAAGADRTKPAKNHAAAQLFPRGSIVISAFGGLRA